MKNEKGFTLIEMMIVLLIISVLLIVTIPNIGRHNATVNEKGCEAYGKMVEAQVQAFRMDKTRYPVSIEELKTEKYLSSDKSACSDKTSFVIGANGEVTKVVAP